jgi:hypothetical protein
MVWRGEDSFLCGRSHRPDVLRENDMANKES